MSSFFLLAATTGTAIAQVNTLPACSLATFSPFPDGTSKIYFSPTDTGTLVATTMARTGAQGCSPGSVGTVSLIFPTGVTINGATSLDCGTFGLDGTVQTINWPIVVGTLVPGVYGYAINLNFINGTLPVYYTNQQTTITADPATVTDTSTPIVTTTETDFTTITETETSAQVTITSPTPGSYTVTILRVEALYCLLQHYQYEERCIRHMGHKDSDRDRTMHKNTYRSSVAFRPSSQSSSRCEKSKAKNIYKSRRIVKRDTSPVLGDGPASVTTTPDPIITTVTASDSTVTATTTSGIDVTTTVSTVTTTTVHSTSTHTYTKPAPLLSDARGEGVSNARTGNGPKFLL
ncbi:hypothetical protein BT63DRAFT_409362 [Microthyrium microscopicum]|uniref:Ubiquitin 3 binding protein But2 C-terminal domain-containing protein n=1 Tax=Microthyrium microscopicum TaxID=703497 RepID=A0A6A6UV04_9PEZI|nr:hypothetical protein BT63DRAFT_409362 [Microthyrium microscopicum]